jgi:CDGSH-type Zn-finger protein
MANPHIAQKAPFVLPAAAGTYWWCTCGNSKAQPHCDGSHKGSGFAPLKVDLKEAKTVAWCGCKQSKTGAFCDGSHGRIA